MERHELYCITYLAWGYTHTEVNKYNMIVYLFSFEQYKFISNNYFFKIKSERKFKNHQILLIFFQKLLRYQIHKKIQSSIFHHSQLTFIKTMINYINVCIPKK